MDRPSAEPTAATAGRTTQRPATRRRVVVSAVDTVDVVVEPVRAPGVGEAVVALTLAGVCGSDKAGAQGLHAFFKPPYHPGHEVVGRVVDVGPDVEEVAPGDRVTVVPTLTCGTCKNCRAGRGNVCERLEFFGCGHPEGGMADYFTIRADRLFGVPDHFDDHRAALIEPMATPVHAVRIAGDVTERAVVILGGGTIGLLLLAAARDHGARRVVVTDPLAAKRALALEMGADVVIDPTDGDVAGAVRRALVESADVVFDCVASEATLTSAVAMAAKGGTVVVVGGGRAPVSVPLPVIQEHEVRLQGAATYELEDYREAVRILDGGGVDPSRLVTSVFELDQASDAFTAVGDGREVKVLVRGAASPAGPVQPSHATRPVASS